jgi:hypothetical protein
VGILSGTQSGAWWVDGRPCLLLRVNGSRFPSVYGNVNVSVRVSADYDRLPACHSKVGYYTSGRLV